jgi:hypothetical protein
LNLSPSFGGAGNFFEVRPFKAKVGPRAALVIKEWAIFCYNACYEYFRT